MEDRDAEHVVTSGLVIVSEIPTGRCMSGNIKMITRIRHLRVVSRRIYSSIAGLYLSQQIKNDSAFAQPNKY